MPPNRPLDRPRPVGIASALAVVLAAACGGGDGGDGVLTGPTEADAPDLRVVARATTPGSGTSDLRVSGGHVYSGTLDCRPRCGDRMLVRKIAGDGTLTLVDSVVVDAQRVNDVKVSADGRLGVITHEGSADGLNGVTLLDLTDPGDPAVITRYTDGLEAGVHNVFLDGDVLYAAVDDGTLKIVDVSDPAAPSPLATFSAGTSTVHDVSVRDGLAFVSHWNAGLVILDVGGGEAGGTPGAPVELGRVELGGQTHNARYWPDRDLVFVGEEDFRTPGVVHVVDVSDLSAPEEVATYRVPGADPPHNFWLDEDEGTLWIAYYGHGVRAVDVTGPLSGRLESQGRDVASLRYDGASTFAFGIQLVGERIYVSDVNSGVWVLER